MENKLQISCVKWFDLFHSRHKLNLFSVPNEGARTPRNGARMKAMGRRAGVADMFLAIRNEKYNGLFIEFKTSKGKQSESQKAFEVAVLNNGFEYFICQDFDTFVKKIGEYVVA